MAESVVDVTGFDAAAIRLARDDGQLQVAAVAGSDEARRQLLGVSMPTSLLLAELDKADDWGRFKFLPHDRLGPGEGDWGFVSALEPVDADDAWQPTDVLVAVLHDSEGVLRGTLSLDAPTNGRRPRPDQRRLLEQYAAKAERAVLGALERETLADQVRLANTARRVVRQASGQRSLAHLLRISQQALVDGFRARGMWIQIFDDGDTGTIYSADGQDVELGERVRTLAHAVAHELWDAQLTLVLGPDHRPELLSVDQHREVVELLGELSVDSILFVPLGAGHECLGNLVLTRASGAPEWTESEAGAALDVGRDLGGAILNVQAFDREHRLVAELQALDAYKSQLIATVSHELKNPLTAVLGHLEILESVDGLPPPVRRTVAAMERGATRLGRIIDDLLLLAKVGDPHAPLITHPVDLRAIVDDVVALNAVEAERRGISIAVSASPDAVTATGDTGELDRVVSNLVGNALKYTPTGGSVTVTLRSARHRVELAVTDTGIGISEADQQQLFTEFFRSSNPTALAQPGTGLGLAIVHRIVVRHGGTIEVDSDLGVGSTFRVVLPAAD